MTIGRSHHAAGRLALVALFAACGEPPSAPPDLAVVHRVQILPDSLTLMEGEQVALAAVALDGAGLVIEGRGVVWETLDRTVATITADGIVTGRQLGPGRVRATVDGRADTAEVQVWIGFRTVSAAAGHSCGISRTGVAYCWGGGELGRLGVGSDGLRPRPTAVAGQVRYASIAAGTYFTCALAEDGRAVCWGNNRSGQLANGGKRDTWVPTWVRTERRFTAITTHTLHACGIAGGVAYCWGADAFGQLGTAGETWIAEPAPVAADFEFGALDAGYEFTCGVGIDGSAACWGDHRWGQLGTTDVPEQCVTRDGPEVPCSDAPVPIAGPQRFRRIEAGSRHACGLDVEGTVWCWGDNRVGQLGNGTLLPSVTPVRVLDGPFVAIAVGGQHSCALDPDGAAFCWGGNTNGTLGAPTNETCDGDRCSTTPVAVTGGLLFTSINAGGLGGAHTCGIAVDGLAYCWGANGSGQLGSGSREHGVAEPIAVWGQRKR